MGQYSACQGRFSSKGSIYHLTVGRGGALHSCSESSAAEPGEGQMANVGVKKSESTCGSLGVLSTLQPRRDGVLRGDFKMPL